MTINQRNNFGYLSKIALVFLLFTGWFAHGQIQVQATTLSHNCLELYEVKQEIFIITTQDEYMESKFFSESEGGCIPFKDFDFERVILVGYKYRGSNCDEWIEFSTIHQEEQSYAIQFATSPLHVCRDSLLRIAWFVIDRPERLMKFRFERLDNYIRE